MADLNDLQPYGCTSRECMKKQGEYTIKNTLYYKESDAPKTCPHCGQETMTKLRKICLIKKVERAGRIKASKWAKQYRKAKMYTYFCERSQDEHNAKDYIPVHTTIPACSNCPACLSEYNKMLEFSDSYLRVRD